MRNIIKKCLAVLLAILINIPATPAVFAQEPEARLISIFQVDGPDASLSRAIGGRTIEPRFGQRLSEGNILSTGWDTQVYIQMDQASILKMDESTRLQVAAARSLLSLTVQSGSALVEVAEQSPRNTIETRVGNTAIGVRGTMYIVSRGATDIVTIIMLSGMGEVTLRGEEGIMTQFLLPAGYVMWIYDVFEYAALDDDREIIEQTYRISGIIVHELNLFELEEIIHRQEYLIETGIVTPEMIEAAEERIVELKVLRVALRAAYLYAEDEEETVRVLIPGGVATPAAPGTPQDDSPENGQTLHPRYIYIRGVRISTALTELNLNQFVGGAIGFGSAIGFGGAVGFGGVIGSGGTVGFSALSSVGYAYGFTNAEIAPLRHMTNLRELTIENSHISDLSPLAGLTNLQVLRLYDNNISSVQVLSGLLNLTELDLNGNPPIADLYTLARVRPAIDIWPEYVVLAGGMIGPISTLEIYFMSVGYGLTNYDIIPLRYMTNLAFMILQDNNISDITSLRYLSNMLEIITHSSQVYDITQFEHFPSLRLLSLDSNQLNDANLSNMPNLEFLFLRNNQLVEVSLGSMPNLSHLDLSGNLLSEVALHNMPSLVSLDLSNNQLVEVSLGNMPSLISLYLRGNLVSDLTPLMEMQNLQSLDLTDNPAINDPSFDWSPVRHIPDVIGRPPEYVTIGGIEFSIYSRYIQVVNRALPNTELYRFRYVINLRHLTLMNNGINNITFLNYLTDLEALRLDSNPIGLGDLTPLGKMTSLFSLTLSDTRLTDITPLSNLKNLTRLSLNSNQITSVQPLAGLTNLTHLDLRGNPDITDWLTIEHLFPITWGVPPNLLVFDFGGFAFLLDVCTCDEDECICAYICEYDYDNLCADADYGKPEYEAQVDKEDFFYDYNDDKCNHGNGNGYYNGDSPIKEEDEAEPNENCEKEPEEDAPDSIQNPDDDYPDSGITHPPEDGISWNGYKWVLI